MAVELVLLHSEMRLSMRYPTVLTVPILTCAMLLCTGVSVQAQTDDLLEGLGGDEAEEVPADATPIEDVALDDDLEEPVDSKKPESAPDVQEEPAEAPAGPGVETIEATGDASPDSISLEPESKKQATNGRIVDRVKAVQKKPVLKRTRVELSPFAALGINDPFYTHVAAGGSLTFFPHDNFGIGLTMTYFLAHPKTSAHQVIRLGQKSVPAEFNLPRYFVGADLHWIPIYGKVSLFNSAITPFDLYIVAGGGIANTGVDTRLSSNIGIGQRFFIGDFLAFRIELRDYMYLDTLRVDGQLRSDIQNYVLLQLGVSLFVPPSFEYGQ